MKYIVVDVEWNWPEIQLQLSECSIWRISFVKNANGEKSATKLMQRSDCD